MKMKMFYALMMMTVVGISVTGCSNVEVEDISSFDATEVGNVVYSPLTFSEVPTSVIAGDSKGSDKETIEITGYLGKISSDKSVAYLWNNGYDSVPDEDSVGKCIVLDLSGVDAESITEDCFVVVQGDLVFEESEQVDVFNTYYDWDIKVASIVETGYLPNNVKEYNDYMDSFEWEAFSAVVESTVTALDAWSSDESIVQLDFEITECDTDKMIQATKDTYSGIYSVIEIPMNNFVDCYKKVCTAVNENKRPDDVDEMIENVKESYISLSDNLVFYGFFD